MKHLFLLLSVFLTSFAVAAHGFGSSVQELDLDRLMRLHPEEAPVRLLMAQLDSTINITNAVEIVPSESAIWGLDAQCEPGDNVDIVIMVRKAEFFDAAQVFLNLPNGFSPILNESGKPVVTYNEIFPPSSWGFNTGYVDGCQIRIMLNGSGWENVLNGEYTLFTVKLHVSETVRPGSYTVNLTDQKLYDGGYKKLGIAETSQLTVTVGSVMEANVTLDRNALSLKVGEKSRLTATVEPAEAATSLTWQSDNTRVATVSGSGEVAAHAVGSATITVTTDTGSSATCAVSVTDYDHYEKDGNTVIIIDGIHYKLMGDGESIVVDCDVSAPDFLSQVVYQGKTYKVIGINLAGNQNVQSITVSSQLINGFASAFGGAFDLEIGPGHLCGVHESYNDDNPEYEYNPLKGHGYYQSDECYSSFVNCPNLTSVIYHGSVADRLFEGCKSLRTVTIIENPSEPALSEFSAGTGIGTGAFFGCTSLSRLSLPKNCMVGAEAFAGCTSLSSIEITGESVVCYGAFFGCSSLSNITLDKSVDLRYCFCAFAYCNIQELVIDRPFHYDCFTGNSIKKVYYQLTVNAPSFTFEPALGLQYGGLQEPFKKETEELIISDDVGFIPNGLLSNALSLKKIYIGKSVKNIGHFAFTNADKLTEIVLPEGLTVIGYNAFADCENLLNITFPKSLSNIWWSAFDNTAWQNSQPDGVVYIGSIALTYKGTEPSDGRLVFKEGTEIISNWSWNNEFTEDWYRASWIKTIVAPVSLKTIGSSVFDNWSVDDDYDIVLYGPPASFTNYADTGRVFYGKENYITLHVPRKYLEAYRTTLPWSNLKTINGNLVAPDYPDINNDDIVDVGDVNTILVAIINNNYSISNDVNSDGKVDVGDVNAVLDAILKQ
ncbi:MAG: leucine-rich repeat protein [Muribaculaceae bacterium]|nr:leucine-rich repeat protein [Muribaculaceae bacterium]